MKITRRARRRIILLFTCLLVGTGILLSAWYVRKVQKENAAVQARVEGLAAAEEGDWALALGSLSRAVAFDKFDIEALISFAEARSRIPQENNRHFARAMNLFSRASDLARVDQQVDLLEQALTGQARMELATGSLARLQDTSRELLELDPENRTAIEYLFEMSRIRGNLLPRGRDGADETQFLIRGARSNAEWLAALRDVDEGCALRWALERIVLDPRDIDVHDDLLAILRDGGSEDAQKFRRGVLIESPLDLVAGWQGQDDFDAAMGHVLMATELLRSERRDEARSELVRAETAGLDDADLLLRAIKLRENLGTAEDLEVVSDLVERAEIVARTDGDTALRIAIRYWNSARSDKSIEILDAAQLEARPEERLNLLANSLVLATLDGADDLDERLRLFEKLASDPSVDPRLRDVNQQILALSRIASKQAPDEADVVSAYTIAAAIPTNFLIQTMFGDILEAAGRPLVAAETWKRASQLVGHASIPVGRRAVRGLLDLQSVDRAFEEAVRFVSASQSVASIISLSEAWLALEASGMKARDVTPQFDTWDSPLEMLEAVRGSLEENGGRTWILLPLATEAAIRAGRNDLADANIAEAMMTDTPVPTLMRLFNLSMEGGLGREREILDRMRDIDDQDVFGSRILVMESALLRSEGRADEALRLVESGISADGSDESERLLGLERLDHAVATGGDPVPAIDLLLASSPNRLVLRRIHRIIRGLEDAGIAEDLSNRLIDRSVEIFGEDSDPTVLARCEHVLAFARNDQAMIRNAIVLADGMIASRRAGVEVRLILVRLLEASSPPQTSRAIEIMRPIVQMRPGRFDIAVRFVDLLQRGGRLAEANDQIQNLSRRRGSAPPDVQRLIPTLVLGQGDVDQVARSLCDLADQTGNAMDRLQCVRARYTAGDDVLADAMLAELLLEEDRPSEVDVEYAFRLLERGRGDEALRVLGDSTVFASDLQQDFALARTLLRLERWNELGLVIDRWKDVDPGDVAASQMQFVKARYHLAGPEPRPDLAMAALDRAVEIAPEDATVLNQNATIRLENPGLRGSVGRAIDLLQGVDPDQARILRLADKVYLVDGGMRADDEDVRQAKELIRMYPRSRPATTLAIEILGSAYENATIVADSEELTLRYEDLMQTTEEAMTRFPGDLVLPIGLSEIYLAEGRFEEALVAAREGLRRSGAGAGMANVIPVAMIESMMGMDQEALVTLSPFRSEIENRAAPGSRSWRLLFMSLMKVGRVEEAWEVFRKLPGEERDGPGPWLSAIRSCDPEIASRAASKFLEVVEPGPRRLPLISSLVSVYKRTGDPTIRTMIEDQFAVMNALGVGGSIGLQTEILRISLGEGSDPVRSVRDYAGLRDRFPTGMIEQALRFRELNEEERIAVSPYMSSLIMVLNNAAAVGAKVIIDGKIRMQDVDSTLQTAIEATEELEALVPGNPEVLDTRAMVSIAAEDALRAIELASRAVERQPFRPSFRITLARALLLAGRNADAENQARQAGRLLRRDPEPDLDKIAEVDSFMSLLRNGS